MKPDEILEALSKLDPTDDSLWTADGQPRLGAIGSNVTRAEVQAVAPMFNRESAEIPTVKEESSLEDKLVDIDLQREEAVEKLAEAVKARADADKAAKEAAAKLESLREEAKSLDNRTPAQINIDLLKASFAERLNRAGAQAQAYQLLQQAGLGNHAKTLTASPVDRAIAERVVAERRKNNSPK